MPREDVFKFLYVGGSVHRKGINVLLRAYLEEFANERNVMLVVKDLGTGTFYRYGNYRDQILQLAADKTAPPILYIDKEMTDGLRASLYAACDCLVAPYHGEGFGLPVLEAMACGLAPIVPAGGATDDFVSPDDGYRIPATLVECDHEWRLTGPATELLVDMAELRRTMRCAFEDRSATKAMGVAAAKTAQRFTWAATSQLMTERIQVLVGNRVLVPTGELFVRTPHHSGDSSWIDPTHRWHLNEQAFHYLDPETYWGQTYPHYTSRKWRITSLGIRGPQ